MSMTVPRHTGSTPPASSAVSPPRDRQETEETRETRKRSAIPLCYRLPLLYIEPLCALNGAYMLYSSPRSFLEVVTPHHDVYFPSAIANTSAAIVTTAAATTTTTTAPSLASVRVLTDMLAGMNLLFAFNLAITLRVAGDDQRLWRVLCSGMLLSDAMHLLATAREFGRPALLDVAGWRPIDWLNFGIMGCMTVLRLAIVAGVGMGRGRAGSCGSGRGACENKDDGRDRPGVDSR